MVEANFPGKSLFEMSGIYRIRVGGAIDPKWSDWLGGMTITTGESESNPVSELVGKMADQAALAGILNALYEMHLPLLRVEFLGDSE